MKKFCYVFCTVCFFLLGEIPAFSQNSAIRPVDIDGFHDVIRHARYENPVENYTVYKPEQTLEIAENILLYQNPDGGWNKNIDLLRILSEEEKRGIHNKSGKEIRSTLDNRNTYTQITFLSEVFVQTKKEVYQNAALRGIEYILKEQRPSGGWRGADVDAITFNDDVMSGTLALLKNIAEDKKPFTWVPKPIKRQAGDAVQRGIECILKCQIKRNGLLTAWGQQHDHKTFESVGARKYEHPCITAGESVGVVKFLMSIEQPSTQIIEAIDSAVAWLDRVQIKGIRIETVPLDEPVTYKSHIIDKTRVVVNDPNAPPIWARYYDIQTGEPFFSRRDGQRVSTLAEVDPERRIGCAWYGHWARHLIERSYPEWKKIRRNLE